MLNIRSLIIFYVFAFFVLLNFNSVQSVIPIYILDVGGTEFFSGLQNSLVFIAAVILRFYFGPFADRKGNKITLCIGGLAFFAAPLLFLLNQSLPYILFVRMIQAVGIATFFPSASAVASALAPKERLGTYINLYRLVSMSTYIMGPILAFKIIETFNYSWYFALGIGIGIISILSLYFLKEPQKSENLSRERNAVSIRDMLELLKQKNLLPIYLYVLFVALFFGLALTFTVVFIEQVVPGVNPGIFFTLFGAGCIVANLITGPISDRIGRSVVVFPCIIIMGAGMAGFYFLPINQSMIYIGSILYGFGHAGCMAALITLIVERASLAKRTTALALQDNAEDVGIALGALVFGALIPNIGMAWSYGSSGGLLILFAIWKVIDFQAIAKKRKYHEDSSNCR